MSAARTTIGYLVVDFGITVQEPKGFGRCGNRDPEGRPSKCLAIKAVTYLGSCRIYLSSVDDLSTVTTAIYFHLALPFVHLMI